MRAEPLALLLSLALAGAAPTARADDGSEAPPDPPPRSEAQGGTEEPPGPAPGPRRAAASADPCDDVPQCRLDRFRRQLAQQRHGYYLQQLDAVAREMDRRALSRMPWRTRYRYGVDLLFLTNLGMPGVVISYAPLWWLKPEIWIGRTSLSHSGVDPVTSSFTDYQLEGFAGGVQARFLPVKFALSPYLAVGWGMYSGKATSSSFNINATGSGADHFFNLGIGLELVVPYFHLAAGYQYMASYFLQGYADSKLPDDGLRQAVQAVMDHNVHGAVFEIGCAF